jgi:hypothetical protein
MFNRTLHKLTKEKSGIQHELDPVWQVLRYILLHEKFDIPIEPTAVTYKNLSNTAKEMRIEKEFTDACKDAQQLGIKLSNEKDELAKEFIVIQQKGKNNLKLWGFKRKQDDDAAPTVQKAPDIVLPEEPGAWIPAGITRGKMERVQAEARVEAEAAGPKPKPEPQPAVPEPPAEPAETSHEAEDETKCQGDGSLLSATRARVAELKAEKEDPPTE